MVDRKGLNMHSNDAEAVGLSPLNRSVIRGAEILRAFKPGSDLLGNGELSERTGLSPSTVSRLTQTLVVAGLLQLDREARAYRLAPLVLSLAHAMRSGSLVLAVAAPHMRALAEKERVNVGLACADREEMVYLESIRYNRRVALRNVVSGQRVPMELTSLGRAYLATTTARQRKSLEATFQRRNGPHWVQLKQALEEAIDSVQTNGYCAASWQPEVVAVSTPLMSPDGVFALNISVSTQEGAKQVTRQLAPKLLALKKIITRDIARLHV